MFIFLVMSCKSYLSLKNELFPFHVGFFSCPSLSLYMSQVLVLILSLLQVSWNLYNHRSLQNLEMLFFRFLACLLLEGKILRYFDLYSYPSRVILVVVIISVLNNLLQPISDEGLPLWMVLLSRILAYHVTLSFSGFIYCYKMIGCIVSQSTVKSDKMSSFISKCT